jgi:hypothetical protein
LGNAIFGLVILLCGGILLIGGLGLCISGVYAGFLHVMNGSVFGAGLVTGAITVLLAGVMLWIGKLVTRG